MKMLPPWFRPVQIVTAFVMAFVVYFCLSVNSAATVGQDDAIQPVAEGKMRFNFNYAPWKDVIERFAKTSNLSLQMDAPPPGKFNYSSDKEYTPAEAIDIMSSLLQTRGYMLVRRDNMLLVVNVEDGVPPDMISTISVDELDKRGTYELCRCMFKLNKITAPEAEQEIQALIGRQGKIQSLPQSRQLLITETGGKLRMIRDLLNRIEDPNALVDTKLDPFKLEHIDSETAFVVIRQIFGIGEGQNVSDDGTFRMAATPTGNQFLVSAKPDQLTRVADLLKLIDVPAESSDAVSPLETPQIQIHEVSEADPETVRQVLETIFADDLDSGDVVLATDPKTGSLLAKATVNQHAEIRATIDEMERDPREIKVISLGDVDPQVAAVTITKFFGGGEEGGNGRAPAVEADATAGNIMVRATKSQINKIETLIEKMKGEGLVTSSEDGNIRTLALSQRESNLVMDQVNNIWPNVRANKIKTVTPSDMIRSMNRKNSIEERLPPTDEELQQEDDEGLLQQLQEELELQRQQDDKATKAETPKDEQRKVSPEAIEIKSAATERDFGGLNLLAQVSDAEISAKQAEALLQEAKAITGNAANSKTVTDKRGSVPGADIFVAVSPSGLVISSKDLDALDDFENLILSISEQNESTTNNFTVFYLVHEKADNAAALLNEILGSGGGSSGGGGGGGGGLLGDLAGAALGGGGGGGGIMDMLGLGGLSDTGGGATVTGSVRIIPNTRLNFLFVEASVNDLDLVEDLIRLIDRDSSPANVRTIPTPQRIPIKNTNAQNVAQVVREVFSEQMAGAGGQSNQPNPQDFIRALRGGGGRGGQGGGNQPEDDPQKVSLSVDTRNNALIVSAPEALFKQIQAVVKHVDVTDTNAAETTRIIPLRKANPTLVQQALSAIAGQSVSAATPTSTSTPTGSPAGARPGGPSAPGDGAANGADQFRQQIEMMRAMRGGGGGGGGGRGGAGGGTGGGRGGGGGGRGGRGGGGGRGGDRG